jgi:hypothetical protein
MGFPASKLKADPMATADLTEADLRREIAEFSNRYPNLGGDELFYRWKRGSGPKAIDVSTFFQRRHLHKEFGKDRRGAANKSRTAFNRAWTKFRKALDEEMVG